MIEGLTPNLSPRIQIVIINAVNINFLQTVRGERERFRGRFQRKACASGQSEFLLPDQSVCVCVCVSVTVYNKSSRPEARVDLDEIIFRRRSGTRTLGTRP